MKSYIKFTHSDTQDKNFSPIVKLLASEDNVEIVQYEIGKNSHFVISPSILPDTLEFYYIVKGEFTSKGINYHTYDYLQVFNMSETIKLTAVEDTVLLYISSKSGEYEDVNIFNEELVTKLNTIQEKDHYTFEHCRNVKRLINDIADYLKLSAKDQKNLLLAGYFHDVGKVKIPDAILNKPDKLTSSEYETMKEHVNYSVEMIAETIGQEIADIIILHHERLDGSGYPKGVSDIPLLGRILAVVDSYDAMTTNRIYKKAKSHEFAINELLTLHDKYDSKIVHIIDQIKRNHA